ncbi:tetratricopeptide repeat protein [Cohnella sp. GCM10027633]|uniref:tetratricopeptide repeat protein n=1 Tax=unclassified Cohnella TaxID=2636738 RepID=UPI003644B6C2
MIKANEMLSKLRGDEPDDAQIEAYYGSTLVLLGRDATRVLDRVDKAEEGLEALNRAVALDPNHKVVRFLRGSICLRLPESFFQCSTTAIEDFLFLLERYEGNSGYLTSKQAREAMRNLSEAYRNAGSPDQADIAIQKLVLWEQDKNK